MTHDLWYNLTWKHLMALIGRLRAEIPNPDEPEPNRPPGALPLDPAGDSSPDPSELRSE